ncbi:MAG: competence/damage-inducible protein A [Ignavibacteria bacterium]|nr:competence/damage-inducible protein A [Ignavibacteria bacterium]
MKIAIITIGDEILIGQIENRNATWIAQQCTEIGASVVHQTVVGDDSESLKRELDVARSRAGVIITTGGLGPTHDDITKQTLVDYVGDELTLNQSWLDLLKQRSTQRGRELSARNAEQAMVPRTATVLPNPIGTALGLLFTFSAPGLPACKCYSLPGVPSEMKAIMERHVIPSLREQHMAEKAASKIYLTLHTTGIEESALADLIGDIPLTGATTLAYLPSYFGVRLRIGAVDDSATSRIKGTMNREINRIHHIILERAGRYVVGEGPSTLVEILADRLKENGETLSVAESCTGGLLGETLTEVQGSSEWFMGGIISYSNDAKMNLLGVEQSVLDAYGAVSQEVAIQMCTGVQRQFNTTWSIGITGVAGPAGGTEEKPVGTVWIGIAGKRGAFAKHFLFGTERRVNRERSVGAAVSMLLLELSRIPHTQQHNASNSLT